MWDRCWIPPHAFMHDVPVNRPYNAPRKPVDLIQMRGCRAVESEINIDRGSAVTEVEGSAVIAGIEVNVDQHPPRIVAW